jgi:hypothetical protein
MSDAFYSGWIKCPAHEHIAAVSKGTVLSSVKQLTSLISNYDTRKAFL